MKGLRTDMVALVCILGGAVVGGGATMAFLSGQETAHTECAVEALSAGPHIVVTRSGDTGGAVVMSTPHIRVNSHHDCATSVVSDVTVHMEEAYREVEEARMQMEMEQFQMQEAMEMMISLREADGALDEAHLDEVRVIIEKIEGGSGGQF